MELSWCVEQSLLVPQLTKESTVVLVKGSAPAVKLDDKHYKLVDKLEALTLRPPSLVDATSLTVKGPVKFVPGIKIVGDVTFVNGAGVALAHSNPKAPELEP